MWPEDTAAPHGTSINPGLAAWLAALLGLGVGGILLGMQELAGLVAVSGLFVAAQAADVDSRWKAVYYLTAWVVPFTGAAACVGIAVAISQGELTGVPRMMLVGMAMGAGAVSLLSVFRPFSNGIVAVLFRTPHPSHTLRMTGRIVIVVLLAAAPGWFAVRRFLEELLNDPVPLLQRVSLEGELVGYVVIALASVGLGVRRNGRETLDRLGLTPMSRSHLAILALGVVGLYALNAGAEWIQRVAFPALWEEDQRVTRAIAEGLGVGRILMLGLSAGIGEEITLRGALQPKLGIGLTSLVFAVLHVQYSWFGIGVIFLISLTLGAIRKHTSTTVAMAVHVIYDVVAVFSV